MAGKARTDRTAVTNAVITVKLTPSEKTEFESRLAEKNEVERLAGRTGYTVSSYVRGLILRDLAAHREGSVQVHVIEGGRKKLTTAEMNELLGGKAEEATPVKPVKRRSRHNRKDVI